MAERREMTPEIKKALMSKMPFSKDSVAEYTPKAFLNKTDGEFDIPVEFQPVFLLRPFTKAESTAVKKACIKADIAVIREWSRKVCTGWSNMLHMPSEEPMEFVAAPDGGADAALWDEISEPLVTEIMMYASCISGILDKDRVGL